jgi:hypothetical protein
MAGVIEKNVLIAFDNSQVWIGQMLGDPLGGNEGFRMRVVFVAHMGTN